MEVVGVKDRRVKAGEIDAAISGAECWDSQIIGRSVCVHMAHILWVP